MSAPASVSREPPRPRGSPLSRASWARGRRTSSVSSGGSYGRLFSVTSSNSGSAPSIPEREPCPPHEIFGYKTHAFRKALCVAGCVLSCGALLLVFYWKPAWDVWANCVPCDLQEADVVLLRTTDEFQRYFKKKVVWADLSNVLDSDKLGHVFGTDKDSCINKAIMKPQMKVRYIQVQKIRYVWDLFAREFHRVGSLEDSNTCYEIYHKYGDGLTRKEQDLRRLICGPNTIEVEIRPIWKLLFKEILNPFYVFQAFTLILWLVQGYIEYSIAIIILSVVSIGLTVYDLRQQSINLHDLVEEHNKVHVTAWTKHEGRHKMESCYLVPGDILVLEGQKHSLPCDAILIDGSCVVNEGMLTGESVPVVKTPLPHTENTMPWKKHSVEDYRRHVLFCGTEVIQTKPTGKGPARAVVLQTGFNTGKGDLVRSILYPKPLNFKIYRDAFKFIVGLALIGVLGLVYAICVYVARKQSVTDTVTMALLLMTVAVPPAIPAALTTGIVYAQKRLKRKKIFCISPQRINICGQMNLVCFDKTGTLTEDGLDLWGVTPCQSRRFQNFHSFTSGSPLPWGPVCRAMATCHSLMVLDGKIQGDPLDLKMFEGTNWNLEESSPEDLTSSTPNAYRVVKPGPAASQVPVEGMRILCQFPFCSSLQRMSVVTQDLGKEACDLYMKGAPEMVATFCKPRTALLFPRNVHTFQHLPACIWPNWKYVHSSVMGATFGAVFLGLLPFALGPAVTFSSSSARVKVPTNFQKGLKFYTSQGFRVIAFAHRELAVDAQADLGGLERDAVESNLTFLGLLIMENRLKNESKPVLEELSAARIRSVMVTGDNLQTAITVAKNSGMISHNSRVILVEASAPKGSTPASVTWQLMEEMHQDLDELQQSLPQTPPGFQDPCVTIEDTTEPGGPGSDFHFALNGKSYQVLMQNFSDLLPKILLNGTVFARMSPGLKSSLIEEFQKLDYYVGMCGDGANDCGALKMAHAGISLSEQEASVASPFTSQVPNIQCVPELIREGRASLVSSFAVFKYLTLYGMSQFIGTSLLYWQLQIFGNYQYLLQDVCITLVVCLTMSLTHAYPKLAPYRPPGQLISPPMLLSIVLNVCFTFIVQVCGFLVVKQQPWYSELRSHRGCPIGIQPLAPGNGTGNSTAEEHSVLSYEDATLWPLVTVNCLIVAFVYSKGKPFRKPIYTNYIFCCLLTLQLGVTLFLFLADIEVVYKGMELLCTPTMWRICILIMLLVSFATSLFVEDVVLQNRHLWQLIKALFRYQSSSQYRQWQRKLKDDVMWPPVNQRDVAQESMAYLNPVYEQTEET